MALEGVTAGFTIAKTAWDLGTAVYTLQHQEHCINRLFGYLIVDEDPNGGYILGLRVGLIVGLKGKRENVIASETKLANITDIRYIVEQLQASNIAQTVKSHIEAVSLELVGAEVSHDHFFGLFKHEGLTADEIAKILNRGLLRPVWIIFHGTNQPATATPKLRLAVPSLLQNTTTTAAPAHILLKQPPPEAGVEKRPHTIVFVPSSELKQFSFHSSSVSSSSHKHAQSEAKSE